MRELIRPYVTILSYRMRANATYRASMIAQLIGAALFVAVETAEVLVYFHNVETLGGLTVGGMLLLMGLTAFAFGLALVFAGNVDELNIQAYDGTFTTWYTRPLSILGQALTAEFKIVRFSRAAAALVVFAVAVHITKMPLSIANIALLLYAVSLCFVTIVACGVISGSLGVLMPMATGFQGVFIGGSNYVAQLPTTIFPRSVAWIFYIVIPVAFGGYLPVCVLSGSPLPSWAPTWLPWAGIVPVMFVCALALLLWRFAIRRYESVGG